MSKFKFKFESIKDVKKVLEKKAQKEVSLIEIELSKLNELYNSLIQEKETAKLRSLEMKNVKVNELKYYENYEKMLKEQISDVKREIKRLEDLKSIKLQELLQKSKEHKIFESLEERHIENFNKNQNKIEQNEVDDIATKKYVRDKE